MQISAEDNQFTANNKVEELSNSGLKARIQETTVDGKKFYRVLVGPYKEKADLSEARKSNLVRSDSFARYID